MARKTLHLERELEYLLNSPSNNLDGVYFAAIEKLDELGVKADKSLARKPSGEDRGTGKMRNVLDWIECLSKDAGRRQLKEDIRNLQVIHASIRAKMRADKHDPKGTWTDEDAARAKEVEEARQKRANKKAAAATLAKELASAEQADVQARNREEQAAKADADEAARQAKRLKEIDSSIAALNKEKAKLKKAAAAGK